MIICSDEVRLENIKNGISYIDSLSWEKSAKMVLESFNEIMTIKTSVIIPTFNGGDLLLEVCKKLLFKTIKIHWEIIIIDSESSDNSLSE